jgi:hypothetical protein
MKFFTYFLVTILLGVGCASAATLNIETEKGYINAEVSMVEVAHSYYRTPGNHLSEPTLFIFVGHDQFRVTKSEAAKLNLTLGELYQLCLSTKTEIFGKAVGYDLAIDRVRTKNIPKPYY